MSAAPALAGLRAGDTVRVVEHDDATRQPRPGGRVLAAVIAEVTALYIIVTYPGPERAADLRDPFWRDSGWRSWDGMFSWRLEPATSPARG